MFRDILKNIFKDSEMQTTLELSRNILKDMSKSIFIDAQTTPELARNIFKDIFKGILKNIFAFFFFCLHPGAL